MDYLNFYKAVLKTNPSSGEKRGGGEGGREVEREGEVDKETENSEIF